MNSASKLGMSDENYEIYMKKKSSLISQEGSKRK
jgi:hypothetical protein